MCVTFHTLYYANNENHVWNMYTKKEPFTHPTHRCAQQRDAFEPYTQKVVALNQMVKNHKNFYVPLSINPCRVNKLTMRKCSVVSTRDPSSH